MDILEWMPVDGARMVKVEAPRGDSFHRPLGENPR
jgi:hypothetical protein